MQKDGVLDKILNRWKEKQYHRTKCTDFLTSVVFFLLLSERHLELWNFRLFCLLFKKKNRFFFSYFYFLLFYSVTCDCSDMTFSAWQVINMKNRSIRTDSLPGSRVSLTLLASLQRSLCSRPTSGVSWGQANDGLFRVFLPLSIAHSIAASPRRRAVHQPLTSLMQPELWPRGYEEEEDTHHWFQTCLCIVCHRFCSCFFVVAVFVVDVFCFVFVFNLLCDLSVCSCSASSSPW